MSGPGSGPVGLPRDGAATNALAGGAAGPGALGPLLATVLDSLETGTAMRSGPVPAGSPAEIAALVDDALATDDGPGALARLTQLLAYGAADPADPACAAHLHCPPLAVAAAADLAVSALNPSQDSWDQAPAATALESTLLAEIAGLVGYDPERAAGVLTSGGTESNLMGLMLARDQKLDGIVELDGIPAGVRPCILASEAAHFSVQRAAALLGLGERAVIPVAVDRGLRMREDELERAMAEASWAGRTPIAVVATAGT
ncbi:pyridoxal phosphate-dependent decarboxylase family protein, partial [Kitasatospora sp. NPDC057512]|uniref:pyridoxal phosphate-dependent decarboxylase family protein n=1 Tax=Kitasatospora sp. NPDC057512 TaxID=3346154 RepID=UPI0036A2D91F